jgi:hypothetical protein
MVQLALLPWIDMLTAPPSVWRPLTDVKHTPLIVCDRRTVHPHHLLEMDQVAPTKIELSMSLQFMEDQKFYWFPGQSAEEVILFTSWDSVQSTSIASECQLASHYIISSKD